MRMFAALVGLVIGFSVAATSVAAGYVEGKDYVVLAERIVPANANKIEVAEFFSYACPHCYKFEPTLQAWAKKLPSDVTLVQTHVSFNRPDWANYQRGYYTILSLGVKDKVQEAIFNSIYVANKNVSGAQDWADFLSLYGVDKQKTLSTYNSFGVNSQIKQAEARTRDFKIPSTPAVIVDGRFRVAVANHEEMVKVAQFLVDKVRAERTAIKP
jgi:protein dithiol oxidoreductase (disulfide-forming)